MTSTLCTAYYTKITLLNKLKLTVLLLIVKCIGVLPEGAWPPSLFYESLDSLILIIYRDGGK